MGKVADSLLAHMPARTGFDQPYADVAELQVAAINERFQEFVGPIKLLGQRAATPELVKSARFRMWCHCCFRTRPTRAILRAS